MRIRKIIFFLVLSYVIGQDSYNVYLIDSYYLSESQFPNHHNVCIYNNIAIFSVAGNVQLWDLSNPNESLYLNTINITALSIANRDSILFALTDENLLIYNIYNPIDPVLISSTEIFNDGSNYIPTDIFIQEDLVVCGLGYRGLKIYDVTNLYSPTELSFIIPTWYTSNHVYVYNNTLISVGDNFGLDKLFFYDITNPAIPDSLNAMYLPFNTFDLVFDQDVIYFSTNVPNINMVDVTNSDNPILLNTEIQSIADRALYISNETLYVNTLDGIDIYDISDPYEPNIVGYYHAYVYNDAYRMGIKNLGPYVVSAAGYGGIKIYLSGIGCGLVGDVDDDGDILIVDILMVVNSILSAEAFVYGCEYWRADINHDDILNILDIVIIIQLIFNDPN